MVHPSRIFAHNDASPGDGPVVYWMSRDQRIQDNWALLFAQQTAIECKRPLCILFCVVPAFLGATIRQYEFMLRGLRQLELETLRYRIPLFVESGSPHKRVPIFLRRISAGMLVTDFSPLRVNREWKSDIREALKIPIYEVDAHNIVPCRIASEKQEYAARTFRPKIHKLLREFLTDFPSLKRHPVSGAFSDSVRVDWQKVRRSLKVDRTVAAVDWLQPGERSAAKFLQTFCAQRLGEYAVKRNDPSEPSQSGLSPYLHFGQLAAQRVALEVSKSGGNRAAREAFLEELIVRRELSDNFCFYNPHYDSFAGFPEWAQKTLNKHRSDRRDAVYTLQQFEEAGTHDDLWNAAQIEMVNTGKMHGFMRMYWAKKILEWSESPEEAMQIAIDLNDKYELDGRDPNGYTGIAWSIGGVHDRPWFERPVFGQVRYMSYNGCKSKFDVDAYINRYF